MDTTKKTLTRNEILTTLKALVKKINSAIDDDDITEEASFIYDLGFDSLNRTEAMMEVEKEFNISIPYSEEGAIQTMDQLIDFIENALPPTNEAIAASRARRNESDIL